MIDIGSERLLLRARCSSAWKALERIIASRTPTMRNGSMPAISLDPIGPPTSGFSSGSFAQLRKRLRPTIPHPDVAAIGQLRSAGVTARSMRGQVYCAKLNAALGRCTRNLHQRLDLRGLHQRVETFHRFQAC